MEAELTSDGNETRSSFGATMAEVAVMAGVTKMTVSRVLRHPEKVNPSTRDHVRKAMKQLGYVPNRVAGSLTSGASGLVATIVPTLRHSLFADTLEGLSDVLSDAGMDLIVSSSAYRTDVEEGQIRSLLERRPDALVLTGLTHTEGAKQLLRGFRIPVVETWETGDAPVDMVVGYSNRDAAHAMTVELVQAGYRRIAFVNGPSLNNERARHRAEGYLAALQEAGLSAPPFTLCTTRRPFCPRPERAPSGRCGPSILTSMRSSSPATFLPWVPSSPAATSGVAVPGEIGIAGFHDLEIGRVVSPNLTTVHVPALEMGRKAAEMILRCLAGERPASERCDLGFSILQRESTRRHGV